MRIVLSTVGSLGDVQPLLALAVELRKGGHSVVLALSPNFEPKVRDLGIEFVALGPRIAFEEARLAMAAQMRNPEPADQVRQFLEATVPAVPQMYRDLRRLCEDADALIGAPFHVVCRMVHDSLGVPYVSLHLSQFGDLGGKDVAKLSAALINPCRMSQGLQPVADPLGADGTSDQLALYAVSRYLLKAPARWPSHYKIVGFFFLEEELWRPSPELDAFCADAEELVAVTFGSIVHDDAEAVTNLVVEAVQQAGCRAVLQQGWSGLGRGVLPACVHATGYVPHSWLFAKVSLAIHHGSAGTTSSAFRIGVPMVVIPHTLDQPIWAAFARSVGCAKKVIPFQELTVSGLADAITETLRSAQTRAAADSFGRKVRQEEGVVMARRHIEEVLSANHKRMPVGGASRGTA